MKVGIILRGISVGTSQMGNGTDWRIIKDNIKENLIDSFGQKHDVSVYLTTYPNETLEELSNFYKPKRLNVVPFEGSNQRINIIQSCLDIEHEDLDFIAITRFDIRFFQKMADLNIDYDKFNILYKEIEPNWSNSRFVSDIIFFFPRKYLSHFIEAVAMEQKNPTRAYVDMHNAYLLMCNLIGEDNIHFIHNEPHPKRHRENDYVEIVRS
jgi:hypothetical protein